MRMTGNYDIGYIEYEHEMVDMDKKGGDGGGIGGSGPGESYYEYGQGLNDVDRKSKECEGIGTSSNNMGYYEYGPDLENMDKKSQQFHAVQLEAYEEEEKLPGENVETKLGWFHRFMASSPGGRFGFFKKLLGSNAETKGIEPVTDEEKTDTSLLNAASMWFTANMVLPAISMGCLGPMVFDLNFGVSVLVICFFSVLGLLPVAFFSVFGAELGLRQMVLSRYLIGNLCARVFGVINTIACVGWGIVNTVAASQLLTLINRPHNMPLWAGCLVIVGSTLLITFFGYRVIHLYQKYSWIPNFAVFFVIIARLKLSGKFSDGPWGGGSTTAGDVLSYGVSVYGFAAGWTTYASDYTVYMPRNTSKLKIVCWVSAGLAFPLFFCIILGAACGRGAKNDPLWAELYKKSSGGGITFGVLVPYSVHGFGQFCCVILAMSTVANNVPNMYTVALSVQSIHHIFSKVPRVVWTVVANLFVFAIACAAAYKFNTFMNYFMDSIGYYISIYVAMALSEHFLFRRGKYSSYVVEDWNNWKKLPVGIAGTFALFCSGFGVAVGMDQSYWDGEAARQIGKYGGDIGIEMGFGIAFVVYTPLRFLELKYFGR